MRFATWRTWAVLVLAVTGWALLGQYARLDESVSWVTWAAKVGTAAVPLSAVAFAVIYGAVGKWWRTDFGIRLTMLPLATLWLSGCLLYAVLFRHGLINTPLLAWMYIAGYFFEAGLIFWSCYLWVREERGKKARSRAVAAAAREAVAQLMASQEGHPDQVAYTLADDVMHALDRAGIELFQAVVRA